METTSKPESAKEQDFAQSRILSSQDADYKGTVQWQPPPASEDWTNISQRAGDS